MLPAEGSEGAAAGAAASKLIGCVVDVEFTTRHLACVAPVRGLLWTVDPESGALVVARPQPPPDSPPPAGGGVSVIVCSRHGLHRITAAGVGGGEEAPFVAAGAALARACARGAAHWAAPGGRSVDAVAAMLQRRRLPYEVLSGGVVRVAGGAVDILPPYTQHTLRGTNDLVLRRVSALLGEGPSSEPPAKRPREDG
eukprot:TRINITY_DN61659_c0_g1_i1.p3 TRINITY_DN61659_c0_g1~~TRINITY_DN61659_c0_g1_i1.p3  ORF type:complete len:218 (+),score=53.99 TRINITY_DN61659_c0_g1_i1:65-655(+)